MTFSNFPQAQIISVEYEPRRYFNWFVVKVRLTFSVATKEEDAYVALDSNFVHDGWLSDVTIPPHLRVRALVILDEEGPNATVFYQPLCPSRV